MEKKTNPGSSTNEPSPYLKILLTGVLLFLLFGITFFVAYQTTQKRQAPPTNASDTVPDVNLTVTTIPPTRNLTEKDGCVVGGCNSELCGETELFSACIYKEEFVCYKSAICEKQTDGKCGWTLTSELKACLDQY